MRTNIINYKTLIANFNNNQMIKKSFLIKFNSNIQIPIINIKMLYKYYNNFKYSKIK